MTRAYRPDRPGPTRNGPLCHRDRRARRPRVTNGEVVIALLIGLAAGALGSTWLGRGCPPPARLVPVDRMPADDDSPEPPLDMEAR